MNTKRLLVFASFVLAALASVPALSADEVVLRFNRYVPTTHHFHARQMAVWAERVEKATNGHVKVEFTPASLGPLPRQYELAVSGVADITSGSQAYTPERFVLSRVAELPFISDSAEALSVAHWRVQEKYFAQADEYKGTKLLAVFNNGPYQIFTTKKPILQISDLKNLKIRAIAGVQGDITSALGVVPIGASVTDTYDMLSRGIIDGTFLASDSILSFKMDKFLGYQTKVPLGLTNAAFFLVMNETKWKSLSKADQDAIMSVSGENFARYAGSVWDDQDAIANKEFESGGMKITTMSPEAAAELRNKLSFIEEAWIKEARARGVDGRAALDMLRSEVANYKRN